MIITELGIDQVNHSEIVTITQVVFSDLSLHYVINPASLTGVTGGNTASVEPTIGLLYNGTINLQATNNSNFSAQSAFIFAKNDEEFLIAVSPVSNNRVNGELSISKIRKLSFNALASDLVLKPEVNSVVASAMAELPHPDFNSIVDSAASDINNAANGYTDNAIKTVNSNLASKADTSTVNDISNALNSKADKTALSDYATNQALTDVSSGITSELAKKADISVLSDKADVATVNDIKTALSDKASVADLSNYYTTSNASDSFKSVDNMLNTRARNSDVSALSNAQSSFAENMQGFTTYASSHLSFLQSKADTDAGNIIYSAKRIDQLEGNIDLMGKPAIVNGTSLDTIVDTGMYPMDNVDLGSLPANLGLPHVVISGALIVRREFNLVQQTIKDNVGNIYVRNMGRAWSKFKSAEIDNVSRDELESYTKDHFRFRKVYTGNILDLANEDDGAYEFYGNSAGGPADFYGYGVALKYHNTWNAVIVLFDNSTNLWTNRQGPGGWTGWRKVVDTLLLNEKIDNLQTQINNLKH